ncbi:MAG: NAD(P)/FAD-dependent oxidoreductase [Nitrospira sp.]
MNRDAKDWDVIIVGSGPAGLSAAVYLGRSQRRTLLLHSGHSMAKWELDVQNYLGFPDGIAGTDLLDRGLRQARRFGAEVIEDTLMSLRVGDLFRLEGRETSYEAGRVLLATGLTHLPPDIPGVKECLGRSLFFCKDCDACRVQGRRIAIIGWNNEAAEYALGMLAFSSSVKVCTNGREPEWDTTHAGWLNEYGVSVSPPRICTVDHDGGLIKSFTLESGELLEADAAFTTRGDVAHNRLAAQAGAALNEEGQVVVDPCMQTSVPGLYAAGCLTPANCQMIIAAGQGAIAGQAINRDLFEESLRRHALPTRGSTTDRVEGHRPTC